MEPCPPRPSSEGIVEHAQAAGLRVEGVDAFARDRSAVGRSLGQLFGKFEPDYVERYLLAAADGLRWVYVQPYSGRAIMPGEHHVPLAGASAAPVLGEGSNWFDENRRFALRMAILCTATIVLAPLGIFLFVKLLPRPPKARGGPLADAIDRLPAFARLRYMGGVMSRDYLLPWTIQLHSVGGGQSRLVCVDPGTTRRGLGILHRAKPSLLEIAELARGVQASLEPVDHPAQDPPQPIAWDELARPWLAHAASELPRSLAPPGQALPGAAPPPKRGKGWWWAGLLAGVGGASVGIFVVGVAISMLVNPQQPNAIQSGWCCLISTTLVCVLPSVAGSIYAVMRIRRPE